MTYRLGALSVLTTMASVPCVSPWGGSSMATSVGLVFSTFSANCSRSFLFGRPRRVIVSLWRLRIEVKVFWTVAFKLSLIACSWGVRTSPGFLNTTSARTASSAIGRSVATTTICSSPAA